MVAGLTGTALLGAAVAEGAGPAPLSGQPHHYVPSSPPDYYLPSTPPVTTGPPTSRTPPPETSPPVTFETSSPVTSPPMTYPPNGNGLPETGVRSLTIAGIGLVLVGLGILIWVLTGRRRVRV